jgi:hypothetical protein
VGDIIASQPTIGQSLRLRMLDLMNSNTDPRTYNTPSSDEIGVLIVGPGDLDTQPRDLVLCQRTTNTSPNDELMITDQTIQHISELNPAYLPLVYVLLLPFGEQGWNSNIPYVGNTGAGNVLRRDISDYGQVQEIRNVFESNNPVTGRGGS